MKYSIGSSRIDRGIATVSALTSLGVKPEDLPEFLFEPVEIECSPLWWRWLNIAQLFLQVPFDLILRPHNEQLGSLDPNEVKRVYDREARWYDLKHHLTTCWNDSSWRRRAAQFVVDRVKACNGGAGFEVLDVCSGTGLTARQIAVSAETAGMNRVRINGIDFDEKMLDRARRQKMPKRMSVSFCLADATKMAGLLAGENFFDAVTLMCGIGGIKYSVMAFEQILRVLKPGGQLWLSDMHVPIPGYRDPRPFWQRAFCMPNFAQTTWYNATVPDALGVLWGWKDPTLDFYLVPFVTYQDGDGERWGFRLIKREFCIDSWWLRMPMTPVCELIVEKEEIADSEMQRRQQILALINPVG